jgi:hypothetical protein
MASKRRLGSRYFTLSLIVEVSSVTGVGAINFGNFVKYAMQAIK